MFINHSDSLITNKNLLPFWCNAHPNQVDVNEPPTRGHQFIMKHDPIRKKIYQIYNWMKTRCYNKNAQSYPRYGGRGIIVCDEWKNNFSHFYNWAIHSGFVKGLQIDRINNDGIYEPRNCKWSTVKEQARNRSTNTHVTIKGETKLLIEWIEHYGIRKSIVDRRLAYKWDIETALTHPVRKRKKIKNSL